MPLKSPALTAEALADLYLELLAEDPEQLAHFMAQSGFDPQSLRQAVGSKGLALGLIDYAAQNEAFLLLLCQRNSLSPESVMRVWAKLNPAG